MTPTISIIIPFYNMEKELHHTLDALLRIEIKESSYELICVDDSSTDGTFAVLKEYEERYPERVRAFKTPRNLRQGGARNLGMEKARGQWIGFMDGDDYPDPLMYAKMLQRAEDTGADVVGCGFWEVHDHDYPKGIIKNGNTQDQTGLLNEEKYKRLILNPSSMVTKIYKTAVLKDKKLDFPSGFFYEDNAAAPIWMLSFNHFELVDEPLYYYYQKPDSTTHTITRQRCYDRMRAGELLISLAKERGFFEGYRNEFEASFTKLYYVNTLFSYLIGCRENSISFLKELRAGILENFPGFRSNPYYERSFDEEQKKLINMHLKSPAVFLIYYRLKALYRLTRGRVKCQSNITI